MTLSDILAKRERKIIRQVLESSEGNCVQAAKRLGISRRTLYRRLHEHKILITRTARFTKEEEAV